MRNSRKHNRELFDLCRLPCIVSLVKCRRLCWAGHLTRNRGDKECFQSFSVATFWKMTSLETSEEMRG
jgi:hypothetical protein